MGNPYSKDSVRLHDISPLFHAKNIKNPIMVLQGANVPRVLQIETYGMVKAARDSGAYLKYVLFEDTDPRFTKTNSKSSTKPRNVINKTLPGFSECKFIKRSYVQYNMCMK